MAAVKPVKALVPVKEAPLPVDYSEYAAYAGDGFQNQTSDDIALPFFDILHYSCPQIGVVEGAAPGLIINKATNKLYKELEFVPAFTRHEYLEWIPLEKNGGLVAVHPLNSQLVQEARVATPRGKHIMANGNELVQTYSVFGVVVPQEDDEAPTPGVIAFSSTRIKNYKQWMAIAQSQIVPGPQGQIQLPLYAHRWLLVSDPQEKKPYKWFTWKTAFKGGSASAARLAPSDPLFQLAKQTAASIGAGILKADMSQARGDVAVDGGDVADPKAAPF